MTRLTHHGAQKCVQDGAQHGIILIGVLWMVAALSIIVMGLSTATRKETQRTAYTRQLVQGQALGDAAIHIALQQLAAKPPVPSKIVSDEVNVDGVSVPVRVQPLNGLIDINSAPKELLAAMFRHGAQIDPGSAEALALAVIEVRMRKDARSVQLGFEATEDLLGVPGIAYPLYSKIAAMVTADIRGSGRVNPLSALSDVLTVLADGDTQKAAQIETARSSGSVGIDTTSLNAGFIDPSLNQRVKITAAVSLPDGSVLLTERYVDMVPRLGERLPWRTFRLVRRLEPRQP